MIKIFKMKPLLLASFLFIAFNGMAQVNLANGLVAYYPFNGNANDESGNGNNLLLTGTITLTSPVLTNDKNGNPNSCFQFGPDMRVFNTTIPSLGSLSVSMLFYVPETSYGSFYPTLFDFYNDTQKNNIQGGFVGQHSIKNYRNASENESGCSISINVNQGPLQSNIFSPKGSLSNNQWYHIVATYDQLSRSTKMYINGVLFANGISSSDHTILSRLNIGSAHSLIYNTTADYTTTGLANYFTGKLDNIRIYNRAINNDEIQSLYNDCSSFSTPLITLTNNHLSTISIAGAVYQWYLNDVTIPGANNSLLSDPLKAGTYKVNTSLSNCSLDSEPIYMVNPASPVDPVVTVTVYKIITVDENGNTITGINKRMDNDNINIYPNPTKGYFTIETENINISNIEIQNMIGNKILETNLSKNIDLTGYPSGVYVLRIFDKDNKIIKMAKVLIE